MTKRKWEGRREGFKVSSTREEAQGPGRPSTRGRFSESWKRLSSRQGSTKSKGGRCRGGTADAREEERRTRTWDHTEMERGVQERVWLKQVAI
ncbi:hypothetical protein QQF64_026920 [Cirrhinus molitorella]|uniref:Uncharacterized protein n=1 Tax=Cirrhinus molitorella TaxID=172907 RepID=A0ABR3NAW1_9TELE